MDLISFGEGNRTYFMGGLEVGVWEVQVGSGREDGFKGRIAGRDS